MKPTNMRIQIEKLQKSDIPDLVKYGNDRQIWLNVSDNYPYPYTFDDGLAFFEQSTDKHIFSIKNNDVFVGIIDLRPRSGIDRITAEIGYWVASEFAGQGIGTKAVELIVEYGFANIPELLKIYARVFHTNPASMRVLEKAGFVKEGVLKKSCIKENQIIDLHHFSIFRKD